MVVCRQNSSYPLVWWFLFKELKSVSPCHLRWDSRRHQLWSSSSWPYCACLGYSTALPRWLRTATAPCPAGSTFAFTRGTAGAAGTCRTTLPLLVSSPKRCSRPWGCWRGWSTPPWWRWRCAERWWRDTTWGRPPPSRSACQGRTHKMQRGGGESEQNEFKHWHLHTYSSHGRVGVSCH